MNTEWIDRRDKVILDQLYAGSTFAEEKGGSSIWIVLQDAPSEGDKIPTVELHSGQFELKNKNQRVIEVVPHHVGEEENVMFRPL